MSYDEDKIDDTVLAVLYLTAFEDLGVTRAWKGLDWDALDRLHAKGFIDDPRGRRKSVVFSQEGKRRAQTLFDELFGK